VVVEEQPVEPEPEPQKLTVLEVVLGRRQLRETFP
jgi:hypothetical protein